MLLVYITLAVFLSEEGGADGAAKYPVLMVVLYGLQLNFDYMGPGASTYIIPAELFPTAALATPRPLRRLRQARRRNRFVRLWFSCRWFRPTGHIHLHFKRLRQSSFGPSCSSRGMTIIRYYIWRRRTRRGRYLHCCSNREDTLRKRQVVWEESSRFRQSRRRLHHLSLPTHSSRRGA